MIETTWSDLVVESVLKGAAVLVLAAVAARLLRRQPAAVRHGVWLAALVAQVLIPVFVARLPEWRLTVPTWATAVVPLPQVSVTMPGSERQAPASLVLSAPSTQPEAPATVVLTAPAEAAPAAAPDAAASPAAPRFAWTPGTVLLAVWALGAAVILLRLLLGIGAVAVLARRARRVKDGNWLVLATELSEEMGLARPVILLRGGPLSVPVTWGILVPAVLLPADADEWPDDRRRAVLLHELAHVRRYDAFAQLLAYVVLAANWFNPLVWLAVRSMRAESERACDDCVLEHGTEPSAYVQDLLAIVRAARERRTPPALAALAMARPSEFEGRVLAILDGSARHQRAGRRAKLATVAGVVALAAPLAAMRPIQAPPVPNESPAAVNPGDAGAVRQALGLEDRRATQEVTGLVQPPARRPWNDPPTPTPPPAPAPPPMPMPSGRGHRFDVSFDDWGRHAGDLAASISSSISNSISASISSTISSSVQSRVTDAVSERVSARVSDAIGRGLDAGKWGNVNVNVRPNVRTTTRGRAASSGADSLAVRGLVAALADSDVEVRRAAVHGLGSTQDPRAVDALIQALRSDSDVEVRKQAAWALGQIEDRRAVAALSQALREDRAAAVRSQAAWALGQMEDPASATALGAALRDDDAGVRRNAVWALGQIEDPRAVPALAQALASNDDVEMRRKAAWALGQIDSREAVPPLQAALRDRDMEVRKQAAWALGQIEDPASVTALAAAMRDSSDEVRKQAAWALGQIESPAAVPALTQALRDASREVRKTAAWALAQIEDPAAVPGLIEMSRNDDVELRRSAAHALGQIRGAQATEALLALLKDADATVRRTAARALGDR